MIFFLLSWEMSGYRDCVCGNNWNSVPLNLRWGVREGRIWEFKEFKKRVKNNKSKSPLYQIIVGVKVLRMRAGERRGVVRG